jgi:hypothetical protein
MQNNLKKSSLFFNCAGRFLRYGLRLCRQYFIRRPLSQPIIEINSVDAVRISLLFSKITGQFLIFLWGFSAPLLRMSP